MSLGEVHSMIFYASRERQFDALYKTYHYNIFKE